MFEERGLCYWRSLYWVEETAPTEPLVPIKISNLFLLVFPFPSEFGVCKDDCS